MSKAIINTEGVKRIIRSLRTTEDLIIEASDTISKSVSEAKKSWDDYNYNDFKQIADEIEHIAYGAAEKVETSMCQPLERIVKKADDI